MKILKAFLGFTFCLFIVSFAVSATEEITSYDVIIDVQKNADIIVTERIAVISEGRQIRRGIFRDLPRLKVDEGQTIPYQYKILSVTRNGESEPFNRENVGNAKQIRIGDADVFLPRGEHIYEITYRVKNEIKFEENFDELYWNVTGNYWRFPIRSASAAVNLPENVNVKLTKAFTGRLGNSGSDYEVTTGLRDIRFETTRAFGAREGLTIAVRLEKGAIDALTIGEERLIFWFKNGALIILSLSLLGIFGYYILSWRAVGRDPDKLPVFPRYAPPEGYSPAAAHHVYYRGLRGDKALISTLVGLGVKNHLTMDVDKKFTSLRRLDSDQNGKLGDLQTEESYLRDYLFPGRTELIELDGKPNPFFTKANTSFRTHLRKNYGDAYYKWNVMRIIFGLAITVAAIIFAVTHVYGGLSSYFVILLVALIAMNILFFFLMPAPTKKGQRIKSEIAGFRLYLKTAEATRLNAVEVGSEAPPPMTKDRYEAFLPYAIALDVEKPWSKHFEKVLPVEAKNYDPHWGSLSSGRYGSPSDFSKSLTSSLSSGVSSAMPQSSGSSGGGGFSGGGGGGGGGGGW